MTFVHPALSTADHARSAAYDLVLLAHVLSAAVGLGAVVVAGLYAVALRRSGPESPPVRRYYRPGVNWAGRVLFLVPVFGVALIAMSQGDWSFSDGWVTVGLVAWTVVALVAEAALWPAEQRLQAAVGDHTPVGEIARQCLAATTMSAVLSVLLVVATVVMVAKP